MSNPQEELSSAEEALRRDFECEVLNRLRQYLCNHLEPERFFPYLQTKYYLDTDTCEQIRSAGTTKNKVNKLLDVLMRSGPRPLLALVKAIERNGSTQKFVSTRIKDEYNKWVNREENKIRLQSTREMQGDPEETAMCGNLRGGLTPPPYSLYPTPSPNPPSAIVPSSFQTYVSSDHSKLLPKPVATPVSLNVPVPANQAPLVYRLQSRSPTSRSPTGSYSDILDTSFAPTLSPSHFRTIDYPSPPSNWPMHGATLPAPEPRTQIVSDQRNAERKVPPPLGGIEARIDLERNIASSQEKELKKYNPRNNPSPTNQWSRPPRVPSEHEVSSDGSNIAEEARSSKHSDGSGPQSDNCKSPRSGTLKSQFSCQAGSIQPSSFNYSNMTSSPTRTINTGLSSPDDSLAFANSINPSSSPRRYNHGMGCLTTRDYSTTLEPILSGKVPMPNGDIDERMTSSRSPTEHEEESIVSQHKSYDSEHESTLQISADTYVTSNGNHQSRS